MTEEAVFNIYSLVNESTITLKSPVPAKMDEVSPIAITVRLHFPGERPMKATAIGKTARKAYLKALSRLAQTNHSKLRELKSLHPKTSLTVYFNKEPLNTETNLVNRIVENGNKAIIIERDEERDVLLAPLDYLPLQKSGKELLSQYAEDNLFALSQTTWATCNDQRTVVKLNGTQYPRIKLDSQQVRTAILRAGAYLVRGQSTNGMFDYEYNSWEDDSSDEYNIVRHAGVTWAILRLYNTLGNTVFLKSGIKGVKYLLNRIEWNNNRRIAFVTPENRSVLGATALSIMALLELPPHLQKTSVTNAAIALGNGLLYLMTPDGDFYRTIEDKKQKQVEERPMMFFPGESLLALSRLWQEFGNYWKKSSLLAAFKQANNFDSHGTNCHWSVQALALSGKLDGSRFLLDKSVKMAEKLTENQYDNTRENKAGGWPNPSGQPTACSAACRLEALGPAIDSGSYLGIDCTVLKSRMLKGAEFIISQQITKNNGFFLPDPEKAHGGIKMFPEIHTVRMDVNQHSIAALLNTLQLLEKSPYLLTGL
jgi:hypothetical protein